MSRKYPGWLPGGWFPKDQSHGKPAPVPPGLILLALVFLTLIAIAWGLS